RDCKLGEVKIRFFGDNLAIAYGSESRVKTSKDAKDEVETLIWTDTWLKRNGRWQIIAAEDLIPAPQPGVCRGRPTRRHAAPITTRAVASDRILAGRGRRDEA